jgi:Zn-dependent protease with chaperone function
LYNTTLKTEKRRHILQLNSGRLSNYTVSKIVFVILTSLGSFLLGFLKRDSFSEIFKLNEDMWVLIVVLFSVFYPLFTIPLILKEERDLETHKKTEERIPSSPYQHILHAISVMRWCIPICIASVIALGSLAFFARDELVYQVNGFEITIRTTGLLLVRGFLVVYVLNLAIFLFAFKEINTPYMKSLKAVNDSLNRGTLKEDSNPTNTLALKRLADRLGLNSPTLFIAEKLENKMSGGTIILASPKEEVRVIIEKNYLHSLSKNELESVFAHELWHAKAEYTELLLTTYERGYFLYWLGLALFFSFGIMSTLAAMLASSTIPWPFLLTNEYGLPMPLITNPVLFIMSAFPELLGSLLTVRSLVVRPRLFGFMADDPAIEEYFADSMSALTTQQPKELASAILKATLDAQQPSEFSISTLPMTTVSLSEYSSMLQPRLLNTKYPGPKNRAKNAFFMHDILENQLEFRVEKDLKRFSLSDFFGYNFKLYFSPFSRMLGQMDKRKIKRIYDFIVSNQRDFNLKKCAKETDSSLEECFAVFVCLLMAKRIVPAS